MLHQRFIFPVGQGGFALEKIQDHVIVYDCGSISSTSLVEAWIDILCLSVDHVNILFISHFDLDHVNSIKYLLSKLKVYKAVTSMIPKDLKFAYQVYTNGASSAIENVLREGGVEIEEVGEEDNETRSYKFKTIWEWSAKSMMSYKDFNNVRKHLKKSGINLGLLNDSIYIEQNKIIINNAFKSVFGSKGPNSKGLIVLSKEYPGVAIRNVSLMIGCWIKTYPFLVHQDQVACMYVGDADLKNCTTRDLAASFLKLNIWGKKLLLMQIPHHGSQNNIGVSFESMFPSEFYFVNDKDINRFKKNSHLYNSLTKNKKLLESKASLWDLILTKTDIVEQ